MRLIQILSYKPKGSTPSSRIEDLNRFLREVQSYNSENVILQVYNPSDRLVYILANVEIELLGGPEWETV